MFKQNTVYDMRIRVLSSDVCSSDLPFYRYRAIIVRQRCRIRRKIICGVRRRSCHRAFLAPTFLCPSCGFAGQELPSAVQTKPMPGQYQLMRRVESNGYHVARGLHQLADEGNFSRAAEARNLTQPAFRSEEQPY